ncbi:glycosyltransferase family protein [Peribacillus simplex]|uniref:glycosyltransferase family protein n=1 Tax=Peribacillus simplex TaxID=1478 RepID=UPI0028533A96|nr:glycosyltransferase family protein [Peribacillus simplex]MDR4926184.1 glycosyltransferase family protein [Peribacillus simplex]
MNNKKISFISCVNDREEYKKSLSYIHSLTIPQGFQIETVAIDQTNSMTAGYNRAMKNSDAKYKVYIHQDVYIINKNFLDDIVKLFSKYPKLGMIGVAGTKELSKNATWWLNPNLYGSVYSSHSGPMEFLTFNTVKKDYEKVQSIDGLIIITQYDFKWRQDLFQGWHFYDASQCLEFIKSGFDVGIPKQKKPWCIHDCGIVNLNGYEEDKRIFYENYSDWIT